MRETLAGSLSYGTQMNRVFGNGWASVDDVVRVSVADWDNMRMELPRARLD
jgi:hypothetical protein